MYQKVGYLPVIFTLYFCLFSVAVLKAGLEPGIRLPAFNLSSLDDREIALQDFLGKIVIIHLWKCQ